ncbi:hypothetical protein KIF53_17040 [Chromobacterium subtsugae]|uniref:Uncharacterized protein n=1 Tax=Chromobacterium subtsugae TaxID=251747 RepID=A0ABS7FGX1_9NEIS|nr:MULTISPECIES: hypothetical protein [Chromobacterium]MBW7568395.1 hypothetical protein [Chromobacterium subtsugae]MBW8289341.1 hypothetical protein [Chromobacterium subtsugae]WSE93344.1 hypothetical protein U6115_08905 [Chromobacterium subtsugae]WVH61722.1 hypothetical protein U6151_08925 [Chromobacterium subtsugae]
MSSAKRTHAAGMPRYPYIANQYKKDESATLAAKTAIWFDLIGSFAYSRIVINFAKANRGQRRFQSIFDRSIALQDLSRPNSFLLPHPAKPGCGIRSGLKTG